MQYAVLPHAVRQHEDTHVRLVIIPITSTARMGSSDASVTAVCVTRRHSSSSMVTCVVICGGGEMHTVNVCSESWHVAAHALK